MANIPPVIESPSPTPSINYSRALMLCGVVVVLGLIVYRLRPVLTPVFFAFLIAYVLDPVVDRLAEKRVPRALAIVGLLVALLGGFVLLGVWILPAVIRELVSFASELPAKTQRLYVTLVPWLEAQGIAVPQSNEEIIRAVRRLHWDIQTIRPAGLVLSWLLGGTVSFLSAAAGLVVVPVFSFYVLHDFDHLIANSRELIPWRYRTQVVEIATEVDQVLGQFIRGQLSVMIILAVLYALAYSLVGVRLAFGIGVFAGLLSFIPYVGGASALGLGLLMGILDWQGWEHLIWIGAAYGAIQVLESLVISPWILGGKVGLSSVWVLFALLVGGELFGFLGVLLAVPAAAISKILVIRLICYYRSSSIFGTPPVLFAEDTTRSEASNETGSPPKESEG